MAEAARADALEHVAMFAGGRSPAHEVGNAVAALFDARLGDERLDSRESGFATEPRGQEAAKTGKPLFRGLRVEAGHALSPAED